MGNTFLTIGMISREHLRVLENNLVFAKRVNRNYDKLYSQWGVKKGATVNLRKPIRVNTTEGPGINGNIQDATETQVPVTLNYQPQVALEFSEVDFTLSIDDFSNRFISPAAAQLANSIDLAGLKQYVNAYNMVGTPGTTPNSDLTYLQAAQRLAEESSPDDNLTLVISPAMNTSIVAALAGLFNPQGVISKQYQKGLMARDTLGFDWFRTQNVQTQVFGAQGGTPVVNGASQTGSTLNISGATASITNWANAGDVFTIAGVYAVNHQSYQSTGALRNFVVTANASSNSSGDVALSIYPAITTSGAFQTVTGSPANSAAVTMLGEANVSSPQGVAFHRDAFALVSADLVMPDYGIRERIADKEAGLSLRFIRQYDINTGSFPMCIDTLIGYATTYPELAVRVAS